jgi:hypothetical protein
MSLLPPINVLVVSVDFHSQYTRRTKLDTLGLAPAQVALQSHLLDRIEKNLPIRAGFDAGLAAGTLFFN